MIEVAFANRLAMLDRLVHQRLGECRFVTLVVPPAAEAVHVDDHVASKRVAEIQRQVDHLGHRLRIFAVDVKDGDLQHLGHVGGVTARTTFLGRRGEADLIVHDDVDGTAHLVTGQLAQVERFLHDPFTGESGVAVDQHGHTDFALRVAEAILLARGSGPA